jgi:diguanylate cyclase
MIDVDHFKAFNDRYGHHVGDHVLRLVATALSVLPGGARSASRFGGEEFAVVLPNVPLAEAEALAEETRASLAERRFIMRGSGERLSQITVSIGLAELQSSEVADQLVRRADAALYRAKRAGGGRIESVLTTAG